MSEETALVAGFADPAGVIAGTCWKFGDATGGALLAGDAVSAADTELSESGQPLRLGLAAGKARGEVTLSFDQTAEAEGISSALGEATVEFELDGNKRTLSCPGHWLRWAVDPRQGSDVVRHLAMPYVDDGLLLLAARRPSGLPGHADEATTAWRFGPELEAAAFSQALVSTQFDGEKRPTRVGLELWPGEEGETHATRGAGTVIGSVEADGVTAAMMRSSAEGREGIGSYLLWRS